MKTQMDYLHMQLPIDGIWHNVTMTGVPVTLSAIDSNGNPVEIGTATTSAYYGDYEMVWTPPQEGTYKIIASFAGDESYSSSGAATSIAVGSPQQVQPSATTEPISQGVSTTEFYTGLAVIALIMIIGLAFAILLLRRKQ
jgi:hypothetical protein